MTIDAATQRIREAIETHEAMVAEFKRDLIETTAAIAEMIAETLSSGGSVFLCGNGGSAADAQHIAGELVSRFGRGGRPLRAVALTTDTSVLTCLANDYSFEDIFARQVEALAGEGDLLWAFSTSGGSSNVLRAADAAKRNGVGVVAFTGRANSQLARRADLCLCADAASSARSQEIHQLAYHIICEFVVAHLPD
jgi:D-sedoheptulose 7-phosphate isomerase